MKHMHSRPSTTTTATTASTCALTLALLSGATLAAPALPDAGQFTRELQPAPNATPAPGEAPLRVQSISAAPSPDRQMRLNVQSIQVQDSTVFAASELQALVRDLQGGEHSLAELVAGADRISAYYHARGYLLAHAYLPAQNIQHGAIVIKVLEGALGQQHINNQSRLTNASANRYLASITPGQALQADAVNRALLLLTDTPGVGGVSGQLQPGTSVGSSDLQINLAPAPAYTAAASLDNYGTSYTGVYRASADLGLNSPLGRGDLLSARLLDSAGLTYARAAYQLPLGANGWTLGTSLSNTTYQLGSSFVALQAHGSASDASVFLSYPWLRSPQSNLLGTLSWDSKALDDQTGNPPSETDKRISEITFGLSANWQDTHYSGGVSNADLSLAVGNLNMDPASLALDAAPGSAQSQGNFAKFNYNLNRLQNLGAKDSLALVLQGQLANKNLASSEKFELGGANAVRAYPLGEGSGDEGVLGSVEWRHRLLETLQSVVFYDAGTATINRNPYIANDSTANSRSIAGAGLGLYAQYQRLQLKTSLAWPTVGGASTADPVSSNQNPHLWLLLTLGL